MTEKQDTLIPLDKYLATGAHIGTQRKLADMARFVYKVRPDGLSVLDIATINKRISMVASFLSKYKAGKVMVACARDVGKKPVQKFSELTGVVAVTTRFMPGSLTNPDYDKYTEPEVMLLVDPGADRQALYEARRINIPIVSLCDTNNMTQYIDLILPINNKGKKSLALVFWLLAREMLKKQGKIKSDDEFKITVEEFEEDKIA